MYYITLSLASIRASNCDGNVPSLSCCENVHLDSEDAVRDPRYLMLRHYRKNLLTNPPATFLASPPEYNALLAKFDAWLNLSALENATVFVIVRMNAMTITISLD